MDIQSNSLGIERGLQSIADAIKSRNKISFFEYQITPTASNYINSSAITLKITGTEFNYTTGDVEETLLVTAQTLFRATGTTTAYLYLASTINAVDTLYYPRRYHIYTMTGWANFNSTAKITIPAHTTAEIFLVGHTISGGGGNNLEVYTSGTLYSPKYTGMAIKGEWL